MLKMKLYNSISRKIEEFIPQKRELVSFYGCGPTVYDSPHIGNLRTFILYDLIWRVLVANGYKVKFVENLTDIDDKISKKAADLDLTIEEVTKGPTQLFFEDLQKLNITPADVFPKATEHVGKMVKYIEELIKKDLAYEKDGSVYFDIAKFPNYGKLSRIDKKYLKTGTRVLSDEYEKDNVQDFALWKAVEASEFGYDSPWGKGRPGWHIECSVMSQEYLGDTLDIHAGGIDLLFPHHENEIAQAEGKTGEIFSKYFVHGEHILVDGTKMSKSKKNFYTLSDIIEKGFDPMAFRYLMLTAHYRSQINFTDESLRAAETALNNLRKAIQNWNGYSITETINGLNPSLEPGWLPNDRASNGPLAKPQIEFKERIRSGFFTAINNDLNIPVAISKMWDLVNDSLLPREDRNGLMREFDKVLGLNLEKYMRPLEIPEEVIKLVEQREKVRQAGNFVESDRLRDEIKKLGYEVEDTPSGVNLKTNLF